MRGHRRGQRPGKMVPPGRTANRVVTFVKSTRRCSEVLVLSDIVYFCPSNNIMLVCVNIRITVGQ